MERLTYWSKKNEQYEIYTDGVIHCGSITDRLAEYEDTGLTPEQIQEMYHGMNHLERCIRG